MRILPTLIVAALCGAVLAGGVSLHRVNVAVVEVPAFETVAFSHRETLTNDWRYCELWLTTNALMTRSSVTGEWVAAISGLEVTTNNMVKIEIYGEIDDVSWFFTLPDSTNIVDTTTATNTPPPIPESN